MLVSLYRRATLFIWAGLRWPAGMSRALTTLQRLDLYNTKVDLEPLKGIPHIQVTQ